MFVKQEGNKITVMLSFWHPATEPTDGLRDVIEKDAGIVFHQPYQPSGDWCYAEDLLGNWQRVETPRKTFAQNRVYLSGWLSASKNLWHEVSEMPEQNRAIMFTCKESHFIGFTHGPNDSSACEKRSFSEFLSTMGADKWAYIDELMEAYHD